MITLTQALRDSEILKLRPHKNYDFKNFDFVTFKDKSGKSKYAQIVYTDEYQSFLLYYFKDSNFSEYSLNEKGNIKSGFLYTIGIGNLSLV